MQQYKSCIEYVRNNLAHAVIFGFNTNIDIIKKVRGYELEKISSYPSLKSLRECVRKGLQKELFVPKSTINFLTKKLHYDIIRIGGQAGNMANDAAKLNVDVYLHLANKSNDVIKLLDRKIFVATKNKFLRACKFKGTTGLPNTHYILEFEKGDVFENRKIPFSNRFIATYDYENSQLLLDRNFITNVPKVIKSIDKAVIAGFHILSESYAYKILKIKDLLLKWKRLNKKIFIHLEMGEFQSALVLQHVMKYLLPIVDSIGFNEFEFEQMRYSNEGLIDFCARMLKSTKQLIYHTREFSICAGKCSEQRMHNSLLFASLATCYKARYGYMPSFDELNNFVPNKPNKKGVELQKNIAYWEKSLTRAFAVPSFTVEKPRYVVGLGDCFTAASLIAL
ncbi:MAG: ADP-dependent glucokinase/phosphofructokinase [Candidatus Thermoplasmatota archaeon]|nr:ADP-dependent glucokinase/phosphofructokinase [Candidatus Thermoplasmatota archaeon]